MKFLEIENLIMAFSLKKNLRTLFDESNEGTIGCVHGIKSIFSIMLYFGHKIIPLGWTSFSNRIFLTKVTIICVLLEKSMNQPDKSFEVFIQIYRIQAFKYFFFFFGLAGN